MTPTNCPRAELQIKKLRCTEVRDGLFSNEKMITVQELGNGSLKFIVPDDAVVKEYVVVHAFERGGTMFAIIPSEYPATVPVERDLLQPV